MADRGRRRAAGGLRWGIGSARCTAALLRQYPGTGPALRSGGTAAGGIGVDLDQGRAWARARQSGLSSGAETVFRAVSVAGVRGTGGCRDGVGGHPGEPGAGVGGQRRGGPIGSPAARSAGPRGQLGVRGKRKKETSWWGGDRKSTRLNSSHLVISYAVFCL